VTRNHASVEAVPTMRTVYVVRYQKPGRTTQIDSYFQKPAVLRRANKLREQGATVAIYTALVGTWTEVDRD